MNGLIEYLTSLKEHDERGKLADIRCVLKDNQKQKAWPYLAQFNAIGESHYANVIQTISGLYAHHHPARTELWDFPEYHNLGDTCYLLLSDEERKDLFGDAKNAGPVTKRFQYLLAATEEEICDRVVKLVFYAKSKGIPVNYNQLIKDLIYWDDHVKLQWAKHFWKVRTDKEGSVD